MKRAYTAAHLPDAHLLAHTLETHGIRTHVFNESLQGGFGELPQIYPEVWIVDEQDWERARALVENFERDVTASEGVVRCGQCHEDNPSTFEICWQCGAVLPELNDPDGREQEEKESD